MVLFSVFNLWALLLFFAIGILSYLVYRKCECKRRLIHIADLTSQAILTLTLCGLMFVLCDLTSHSVLGQGLSFIILANFYAALFNTSCRIFTALK